MIFSFHRSESNVLLTCWFETLQVSWWYTYTCIWKLLHISPRKIVAKVDNLHPAACTSLGPALSVAMGIVSGSVGSEIILCTDGAPNGGIGSLSSCTNDNHFYVKVTLHLLWSVLLLNYPWPIQKSNLMPQFYKSYRKFESFVDGSRNIDQVQSN